MRSPKHSKPVEGIVTSEAEHAKPHLGEAEPSTTMSIDGVVVSKAKSPRGLPIKLPGSRRNQLVAAVVIIVAAAGLLSWHPWHHQAVPSYATIDLSDVPHEYDMMTDEQAKAYLYKSTGLTQEDIMSKHISGSLLKTYDQALSAAEFLKKFDADGRSLQAYKIAFEKNDNAPIAFNKEYALVALQAGKKDLWKQQMEIARNKATKVTTLSTEDKQILIGQIDRTIKTVEAQQ